MAEIPDWMTAIDPSAKGGPEILVPEKRPVPKPGREQLLIRVAAAGVNRPDVSQRIGAYPPPPGAPSILGLEVAGEVVALGEGVMPELLGQPVCALVAGGGYAEYVVAEAGLCLPVPNTLSMVEAAAIPETLFTVWSNVFERAYAADGDRLLVHGGTSGIGTMAILLGRIFQIETIVTVGSDDKAAAALKLGAAHAINYRSQDYVEEVRRITGGKGVDVVLDMVGGDYVPRNIECMADDGRHVSIAVLGGPKAEIPLWKIMQKRLTLTGSTLRPRNVAFKAAVAQEIASVVWPHVEEGRLKPVIDATFPLERAADAHRRLDEDHIGKVVLLVGSS
ncbi:NAD(P)H-quinone oxidoreductase [Rhizorhabdus dicambivorans]|uniref:NAD(P)H-quinone oxidoreductase n=1 Tax=Rhizorhabdus dicambivorans TaxID=1850238 RepID=A0A2A4FZL1_9SPHN|nr:NAD(P)H-quinone oxidoreductase [Rhizorhabdus dicambivorans]ATE64974.1 NAD(P)H-quinone oxidoreductase [Rhizorhabdus dicambivorans]PCE44247.1 NAD(P)H-quinone oxidoreductase [Rhizorhabdus dicambivorans]